MKKKYPEGIYDGGSKGLFSKVRHGYGKMKFYRGGSYDGSDCVSYEGEWKDDKISGYGKMTYGNGGKYEGEFKDGRRFGNGTYRDKHGNEIIYESQSSSHGKGKKTFHYGYYYIGEFMSDKCDGIGTLYNGGGEIFGKGTFKDERIYTGWGKERNLVESYEYEGEFVGGKFHGKGLKRKSDGTIYEGEFHSGKEKGVFKVTYPDGSVETVDFSAEKKRVPINETTESFIQRVALVLKTINATDAEKKAILDVAKEMHQGATRARANAEESGKKHYLKSAVRFSTPRQEADIAKKHAEKAGEIARSCEEHILNLGEEGKGTYRGEIRDGKMHGHGVFAFEQGEVAGLFKDNKMESVVIKTINGGNVAGYHSPDGSFELKVHSSPYLEIEICSHTSGLDGVGVISSSSGRIYRGYIKDNLGKGQIFLDGVCTYNNGSVAYGTFGFANDKSEAANKTVKIKYADGSVIYGKYDGAKHDGYCIDEDNGKFRFMLYKDGERVRVFEDK